MNVSFRIFRYSCIIALLMCSSCMSFIKVVSHPHDLDPYSDNRNEDYSLFGCYWNDDKYIQYTNTSTSVFWPAIQWNIVEIDGEEFIIARINLRPDDNYPQIRISGIGFILPFGCLSVGEEYYSDNHCSYAFFSADETRGKIVGVPIHITYEYNRMDEIVQGTFVAKGEDLQMMPDGTALSIVIERGIFSFNKKNCFDKEFSYDSWLNGIKDSLENSNQSN